MTTFFGPESFGGDADYVDRLSRALVRRGHEVEIVHCADSFRLLDGWAPKRNWAPLPPEVKVHTLSNRAGRLAPLWTHQTGTPGPNAARLRDIFESGGFDVIHFHNVSLLGGPGVLGVGGARAASVRLMTLHDYWLVCPMHLLWKLGRRVCDRPQSLPCTLHGRRPPQLWRETGLIDRGLEKIDALLAPSHYAAQIHRDRGITRPILELPYHLPADWAGAERSSPPPGGEAGRPYFAAAGRLVDEKGFDRLIELMAGIPDYELRVAGAGPREEDLRRQAASIPNVRLLGLLSSEELAALFGGARAVVVPSRFPETFGYVAVEALSTGTPAIVSPNGALPELIDASGGGIVYRGDRELVAAIRRLGEDDALRSELATAEQEALATVWSEQVHLDRYLEFVDSFRASPVLSEREAAASSS